MENPLSVFISSVIAGMAAERQAVEAAIKAIPLSRPWRFESAPASSLPLQESYLGKVRGCDIFVLLLKDGVTDAVKLEASTAAEAGRPRLVFLWQSAPGEVAAYARSLGVKYAGYQDAADLAGKVAEAAGDELISGYRQHKVPLGDLGGIGDFMAGLAGGTIRIDTGGGAFVAGSVYTGGGAFVSRDFIQQQINNITAESPPEDLLKAYYRALAADCRRLPLGVIDTEFVRTSGEQPIPLPDIYVDLDVVAPAQERWESKRAWALRLARGEGEGRRALLHALAAPAAAHTVLLGDAGSGKTTFVNYLTYLLAAGDPALPEAWRGLLPVRLVLREVAARCIPAEAGQGTAAMLWEALGCDIAAQLGGAARDTLLPYLQKRLLAEGGFILLDGLDEVPEARHRRAALLQAVRGLAELLAGTPARILVTARPYAYADQQWRLHGFAAVALAPFGEAQIARFVTRWYAAAAPFMGWSPETAYDRGLRLQEALQERAYLADLASRPLLLTLMATLHSSWGQLPEDRAGLYEETVKLLLGRWQRAREVRSPDGEVVMEPGITQALGAGEDRIRAALERLAYAVHATQRSRGAGDDGPADIAEGEVLVAFKPLLGALDPATLLSYLRDRAGLLVALHEDVYAFPHRSFQEYLAACHLANTEREFAARLRELVWGDLAWWREVFLLGVGKKRQGGLGDAVNVINTLTPQEPQDTAQIIETHWRAAALAGQALLELRLKAEDQAQPYCQAVAERIRRWLARLVEEGRLEARERAAAGDGLGRLGDPRFDPALFFLPCRYRGQPEPAQGFVEVPAGPFVMGSRKGDEGAFANEFGNPPQLTIPYRYWIARCPVTVAQFGAFCADDGYAEDAPWWTATGRAWRRGAWDSRVREDYLRDWLARRPKELRAAPMWWAEQQPYPNRAVTGVAWFEAAAYCRWLDPRLRAVAGWIPAGYGVRLPSEAEWEKAARGEAGRTYAWGDEAWDEQRANIKGRIGHASPVGSYPRGATPPAIQDLTGNVWEWTQSLYQRYPYRPDDGRNDPEAEGARVVRGGSWLDNQWGARCACRGLDHSWRLQPLIGFRLVVSLSDAGF